MITNDSVTLVAGESIRCGDAIVIGLDGRAYKLNKEEREPILSKGAIAQAFWERWKKTYEGKQT